ncbi:molybdopterin molybdotransferase MoeA [Candidatus Methylocalor cossyra]|uniref:Molybdopterin molybdenumtransferase n=1 Tax=Candidatus Methylocalor cossyra TaxID=3108543 RepID=A0ABM9NHH0_9GAMM
MSTFIRSGCGEKGSALRVEDALHRMLDAVTPVKGYEQVGLLDAWCRVLHEPVVAAIDVPSRANAAVDGYAVRAADLPGPGGVAELAVIGTARAGHPFPGTVQAGQAVRIMTGAHLPEGADTVLPQEQVEAQGAGIRVGEGHGQGDNVRLAGEDIARGTTVLAPGRYLTPPDIGLIASLGQGEVKVKRRPRVALLSTGDELCALGHPLPAGGLYDSNRYTLHAALKRLNVKVMDQGIVPDEPERLREALTRAAANADVVVSSGGVSVGEADFVRDVLLALGSIELWKVAMKPGRPIAFGRIGGAVFIGLPGNPVAALVCFFQFVQPVLEKKMGISERPVVPVFKAIAAHRLSKKPGRTEFQRGILDPTPGGWRVRSSGHQGSAILTSMSRGNCLIVLPHDAGPVEVGEAVDVVPFAAFM